MGHEERNASLELCWAACAEHWADIVKHHGETLRSLLLRYGQRETVGRMRMQLIEGMISASRETNRASAAQA